MKGITIIEAIVIAAIIILLIGIIETQYKQEHPTSLTTT